MLYIYARAARALCRGIVPPEVTGRRSTNGRVAHSGPLSSQQQQQQQRPPWYTPSTFVLVCVYTLMVYSYSAATGAVCGDATPAEICLLALSFFFLAIISLYIVMCAYTDDLCMCIVCASSVPDERAYTYISSFPLYICLSI